MLGRFSKRAKILGAVFLLVLLCLSGGLLWLEKHSSRRLAGRITAVLNRGWGEPRGLVLEIGTFRGTPLTEMVLSDFHLAQKEPPMSLVRADTVRVDLAFPGFLRGKTALRSLSLVNPEVHLPGKDETPEKGGRGPVGLTREIVIREFSVIGGQLAENGSGENPIVENVNAAGFLRIARDRLNLRLDRCSGTVTRPGLQIESVTGWVQRSGSQIKPKLTLDTPQSSLTIRGEVYLEGEQPTRLRVGLHDLWLAELAQIDTRVPDWADGWVSGVVYLSGAPNAWDGRVSLTGQVGRWPAMKVRGLVSHSGRSLAIPELALEAGGSRLAGERINLALDSGKFDGRLRVSELDLSRFVDRVGEATNLNAGIEFSGEGLKPDEVKLSADIEVAPSTVGAWSLDACRLEIDAGRDWLDVKHAVVAGNGWSGSGRTVWRREGDLRLEFECEIDSLDAVGRSLGRRLAGKGDLRVGLEGAHGRLSGRAALDLEGFSAGEASFDSLLVDVTVKRDEGPIHGSWFVDGRGFSQGSLRSSKIVANLRTAGWEIPEFEAVGQIDSLLVDLAGAMTDWNGTRTFAFSRAEISSAAKRWRNEAPVHLVISTDRTELMPSRWLCAGGGIGISAEVQSQGGVRVTVDGDSVCLGGLADVLLPGREIEGRLDLDASITGMLSKPRGRAVFRARPVSVGGIRIDAVEGALVVDSDRLAIDSLLVAVGSGWGWLEGSLPARFALGGEGGAGLELTGLGELELGTTGLPLATLVPRSEEGVPVVAGLLDLTARFSGQPDDPTAEVEAHLENARLKSFQLGSVDVRSRVADHVLAIDELKISKGAGEAKITGTLPLESVTTFPWFAPGSSGVSLRAEVSDGEFSFLPSIHSSVFKSSGGRYDLELAVSGSLDDPLLDGTLNLHNGNILVGPIEEPLEAAAADLTFDGRVIHVDRIDGRLGGGLLSAEARVTLDSLRARDYWVRAQGERVKIASLLDAVEAVGDVDLTVRPDTTDFGNIVPNYSGRIDVRQAEVTRELSRSDNGPGPPMVATGAPRWTADLTIEGASNIWLRNSDAEIEFEGSVLLKKDEQGTKFLGDVQTVRGRYFLYSNEFRITSGSVEFADVNDVRNARLDIHAETEVATDEGRERISLDITGTIAKPYLAASSERGYSEPEIFRLLTLGGDVGEAEEGTGTPFSRALARSWGRVLARRFGTELARSLGLDEVEIEPGPGDLGDPEFVEGARVGVGKYVSDRLYLKYKQSLAVNPLKGSVSGGVPGATSRTEAELPDRQLILEYRLSRSFSLDGEASVLNGKPYFNFDVKFRHRY